MNHDSFSLPGIQKIYTLRSATHSTCNPETRQASLPVFSLLLGSFANQPTRVTNPPCKRELHYPMFNSVWPVVSGLTNWLLRLESSVVCTGNKPLNKLKSLHLYQILECAPQRHSSGVKAPQILPKEFNTMYCIKECDTCIQVRKQ